MLTHNSELTPDSSMRSKHEPISSTDDVDRKYTALRSRRCNQEEAGAACRSGEAALAGGDETCEACAGVVG